MKAQWAVAQGLKGRKLFKQKAKGDGKVLGQGAVRPTLRVCAIFSTRLLLTLYHSNFRAQKWLIVFGKNLPPRSAWTKHCLLKPFLIIHAFHCCYVYISFTLVVYNADGKPETKSDSMLVWAAHHDPEVDKKSMLSDYKLL